MLYSLCCLSHFTLSHVVFTFLAHSKTSLLKLPSVLISYLVLCHIDHKLLQFSIA